MIAGAERALVVDTGVSSSDVEGTYDNALLIGQTVGKMRRGTITGVCLCGTAIISPAIRKQKVKELPALQITAAKTFLKIDSFGLK